jgi:hypothetical protein
MKFQGSIFKEAQPMLVAAPLREDLMIGTWSLENPCDLSFVI